MYGRKKPLRKRPVQETGDPDIDDFVPPAKTTKPKPRPTGGLTASASASASAEPADNLFLENHVQVQPPPAGANTVSPGDSGQQEQLPAKSPPALANTASSLDSGPLKSPAPVLSLNLAEWERGVMPPPANNTAPVPFSSKLTPFLNSIESDYDFTG